ncbi:MAG TPA: class I SAM-dependent methyltransferase [Vicinamibacterales bacterium]|nr:class I SAM-dependent methyltransferase [Vicinamibacterales bacterium]
MIAAQKAYRGVAMEGVIATWYTKNTGRDLRRFKEMAQAVARRAPAGARVLEVAPGPGYLSIELAQRGYRVTALDISKSFVHIAQQNAAAAGVPVDVRLGNASAMPLPDASFDFIVCSAAFKNFSDPIGALNEMHRVLEPGGQASIFDLRKDAGRDEIDAEVDRMQMSPFNAWMTRLTFRFLLLRRAYTHEAIQRMAAASRFRGCEIIRDGIGFELRLTKAR